MSDVKKPKWLEAALKYNGLKEIPGPKHNPTILGWIKKLGGWFKDDETPWCGTFVGNAIKEAGIAPVKDWYRAKAWLGFGVPVSPRMGAIGVKGRVGGGHVFFYVGEDATHYHVLGGNQNNMVNVMRIKKSEVLDWRWPSGHVASDYKPRQLTAAGVPTGLTEA